MFPPSTIFRRQPTFAFWQPMLPPRKSSSSSGSGELPKYGSICAKYFPASYQVSHSGPNQSLFLPLLLGSASIQESIIFPSDLSCDGDNNNHCMICVKIRDEDWRIYCLKITRTRDEVGSLMFSNGDMFQLAP